MCVKPWLPSLSLQNKVKEMKAAGCDVDLEVSDNALLALQGTCHLCNFCPNHRKLGKGVNELVSSFLESI